MVLNFTAHYSEGVVASVVIDVDSTKACGSTSRNPLLIGVVIYHDSSPRLTDTLLTEKEEKKRHMIDWMMENYSQAFFQALKFTQMNCLWSKVVINMGSSALNSMKRHQN